MSNELTAEQIQATLAGIRAAVDRVGERAKRKRGRCGVTYAQVFTATSDTLTLIVHRVALLTYPVMQIERRIKPGTSVAIATCRVKIPAQHSTLSAAERASWIRAEQRTAEAQYATADWPAWQARA